MSVLLRQAEIGERVPAIPEDDASLVAFHPDVEAGCTSAGRLSAWSAGARVGMRTSAF